MSHFRKKPVEVKAVQWTGDNLGEVVRFGSDHIWLDASQRLRVETLEGTVVARLNDWIIQGVAGEFYPCKPQVFEQTYEAVP